MTEPAMHWFVADPPDDGVRRNLRRIARLDGVVRIAVMPDVHVAGRFCVGTVIATQGRVYPDAVGGDIGCGVTTARLDVEASDIDDAEIASHILQGFAAAIPIQRHRARDRPDLPDLGVPSDSRLGRHLKRDGSTQFATLGRGNHFLELQRDEDGGLWVAVHAGSRSMGEAVRALHGEVVGDGARDAYLHDVAFARRYAAASRRAMLASAVAVIGGSLGRPVSMSESIECDHNHVQRETHGDVELLVHRKGAIRAREGEPGVIPGSMGTATFHVLGRGHPDALTSCSHGAGRRIARGAARAAISTRDVLRSMRGVWFDTSRADRLRDEAPGAYKDVERVMRAQRELVRITRRLFPVLNYKGA